MHAKLPTVLHRAHEVIEGIDTEHTVNMASLYLLAGCSQSILGQWVLAKHGQWMPAKLPKFTTEHTRSKKVRIQNTESTQQVFTSLQGVVSRYLVSGCLLNRYLDNGCMRSKCLVNGTVEMNARGLYTLRMSAWQRDSRLFMNTQQMNIW